MDAERTELLAWVRPRPLSRVPLSYSFYAFLPQADRVVARNSHYGPKHPLYKPPPPGATTRCTRQWRYRGHARLAREASNR